MLEDLLHESDEIHYFNEKIMKNTLGLHKLNNITAVGNSK